MAETKVPLGGVLLATAAGLLAGGTRATEWAPGAPRAQEEAVRPRVDPLPDRLPEHGPERVSYRIEARLEPDRHTIRATERVTWRNQTTGATAELWWHVYNNAWAGRDSLWLQEARLLGADAAPRAWGGTEIHAVRLAGGAQEESLDLPWSYVAQPGAPQDRTVMKVELPAAVPPGGEVTVEVAFTSDLPPAFRRSGHGGGGFVHAVQWYPKLGVFEELGGALRWNCEPYHYLTEFYADYGDYELQLTLPEEYRGKVAASGSSDGEPVDNADGTVTYRFTAQDIHDFAWTADPDFVVVQRSFDPLAWSDPEEEARVAAALGRPASEILPRPTEMILMLQKEHSEYEERYLEATAKALYYFGLWYGPYPYETISIIDPAHDARETGGMEYPRLFTGGVRKGRAGRRLSPEGVTVHEFGHQFWYGLVGNDEVHHAWMDEGFNTFSTNRVLARGWPPELATYSFLGRDFYGRSILRQPSYRGLRALLTLERLDLPEVAGRGPLSLPLRRRSGLEQWLAEVPEASTIPWVESDRVLERRSVFAEDIAEPMERPTFQLLSSSMRGVNAYARPALTLETMARLMGEERWTRLMRAYAERWRFGHPRPDDFFEAVKEHATGARIGAIELDWPDFWKQAYEGNDRLDFGVHRLANIPVVTDPSSLEEDRGQARDRWDVMVEVRRYGGFRVPIEIEIRWEDGSTSREVWDGQDWWWRLRVPDSPRRAAGVVLDPERRLLLDCDWLNNARSATSNRAPALALTLRAWIWAQQVLHYFGGMG